MILVGRVWVGIYVFGSGMVFVMRELLLKSLKIRRCK